MCIASGPDYYLVFAGPNQAPIRARGPRPWLIESAYLMEDSVLRGLVTSKIGVATSIRREVWEQHQIFPIPNPALMMLSDDQTQALRLFGASPI